MNKKYYYLIVLITLILSKTTNAAPPIVSFNTSPSIGCATPHTVFFTDTSINDSVGTSSWLWDFGDSNTSTVQNPVHNYVAAGDYIVSLTITNADGNDTATDQVQISIPTADIGGPAFGYFGCGPLDVNFVDNSLFSNSTSSSWFWEFGNGDTSNQQNPQYTYLNPGIYTISLTITDANGCTDTQTKPAHVQVIGPNVSFSTNQVSNQAPSDVDFTDLTIFGAPITSWTWDFDDAMNTSNLQNPSHTYNNEGIYTPSLTVTDIDGCSRTAENGSITVVTDQIITFNDPADQIYSLGGTFNAPATSDSGLVVTLTSNSLSVCTVTGNTVTILSTGTCSLTASQSGSAIYNPAMDVDQTVIISQANQTVTFNDPLDQIFSAGGIFNAPAISDSGLVVSITSNSLSVCSVIGNTVTILSAGTCSLTASQSGNINYNPAIDVTQTIAIAQADQTITFNDPVDQTFISGGTFNVPASSDSGLTVTINSNDANICTISGFIITMVNTGVCSLTASQLGDANYNPAVDVTQTVNINPADNDGVDDLIENAVPDADGSGFGDGDGNGILDSTEDNVASFVAFNGSDYFTVKSNTPLSNLNVSIESLVGLTENVSFPYDFLGFTINDLNAGETVIVEVYVPYNQIINSYWKQGNDNHWSNIATNISHIGNVKTKITIQLTEGGNFDSDSDSSTLTDPGAAAVTRYKIPVISTWMIILLVLSLGLVTYSNINRNENT